MKPVTYWTGATILIVALLVAIFLGGNLVAERHWPFHLIWGGFIGITGISIIVVGRTFPHVLWGIRDATTVADPRIRHRAAWVATIFGAIVLVGGAGFAFTHRVGVLIGAFAVGVLFLRTAVPRSPDDEASGPAA